MKLSKEKRDKILLVGIGTLMVLVGIYFGLVSPFMAKQKIRKNEIAAVRKQLDDANKVLKNEKQTAEELAATQGRVSQIEAGMAQGDLASWGDTLMTRYNEGFDVEIIQIPQPMTKQMELMPNFPYMEAIYKVDGRAYYHDLGKFIADFENRFPYKRVQNLELSPASTQVAGAEEKLYFKLEIVSLIKPATNP